MSKRPEDDRAGSCGDEQFDQDDFNREHTLRWMTMLMVQVKLFRERVPRHAVSFVLKGWLRVRDSR